MAFLSVETILEIYSATEIDQNIERLKGASSLERFGVLHLRVRQVRYRSPAQLEILESRQS